MPHDIFWRCSAWEWKLGVKVFGGCLLKVLVSICGISRPSLMLSKKDSTNSHSVHILRNSTWMAALTLAPEDSGSLAKLQPIHKLLCLRSGCDWDCRMSGNNKRKVNQEISMSICIIKQEIINNHGTTGLMSQTQSTSCTHSVACHIQGPLNIEPWLWFQDAHGCL